MKMVVLTLLALLLLPLVKAQSPIGYEFLDNKTVLHSWNPNDDYYFDTDSGLQFTNNYQEYWSRNIFCLGWKTSSWNYKCNDNITFDWTILTDNTTYWEAVGYKDTTIENRDVRIALRYYLHLNDTRLTVQPFVKNIDTQDINNDLRFVWKATDINIGSEYENNTAFIGDKYFYYLNGTTLNELYNNNLAYGKYVLEKDSDWLGLWWNTALNDKLLVQAESGQYNAPVTLLIDTVGLNSGQNKTTLIYWKDAPCAGVFGDKSFNSKGIPSDFAQFYDGNNTNHRITCHRSSDCPTNISPGLCAQPQNKSFVRCLLQQRNNGTPFSTISQTANGNECSNNDDSGDWAEAWVDIPHNNLTDFRCRLQRNVFADPCSIEPCCKLSFYPNFQKQDDWWNNNHTPFIDNFTFTQNTNNQTCSYDFGDEDGDLENTSKTNIFWFIAGERHNPFDGLLTINSSNPNQCCIQTFDDVFETGNEAVICSQDNTFFPIQKKAIWPLAVFVGMITMGVFWNGKKKRPNETDR